MAAAVTLDLLARPGSLATGERAGLVVAPRPFRALRRRIDVIRRYRELVAWPGGRASDRCCPPAPEPSDGRGGRASACAGVLEEAGGVYIKLGQIAATRVDLLPP